jgi:hypothetical protein
MTDFERPVHDPATDPATDPDVDTTATPVPTSPVGAPPPTPETGSVGMGDSAGPLPSDRPLADANAPAPAPAPRQSRARWLAAAGLIALIVGVTAIGTLVLTGSTSTSKVAGFVPADSVMYGEVRLDLPGDQRQKVGQFLSKFPGFADQAALEGKLDEVLDRLTTDASDGKQTYSTDIKPWFDGQLAFSVGAVPTSGDPEAAVAETRALLVLSIKDEAKARAWFGSAISESGKTGTTEDYKGAQLTLFDDAAMGTATKVGYALVGGKVAIAGDSASIKAAIDTKGDSGLTKADAYTRARAAIAGEDVGFVFMDLKRLLGASLKAMGSAGATPPVSDSLLAMVPDWTAMRMRVEGDALLLDGAFPHTAAMPGATENRANKVADFAPPSTIVLIAGNDYGKALVDTVALYRKEPSLAEAFAGIDQVAGMLGGPDSALGWMGDTGLVVARNDSGVEGGLVSVPKDAAGGRQLLTTLRSFLTLGGAQAGITVRDEDYNGTTITIVDLGSIRDLAGMAGALGGTPLPTDPGSLPDGHVELAYAASDAVVVIGSSPDFVKHALDAGAGASLADDARFQGLVGRAGATHTGVNFVDVAAIRGLVEGMLANATPQERADYEESVKPFLEPFDAFIGAGVVGGDIDQTHALITVK